MNDQPDDDEKRHDGGPSFLRTAMKSVEAIEGVQHQDATIARRVADAVAAPAPVFNTHSHGVDALLASQELSLKAIVADLDSKIAALEAERTDAMLAFSMLNAARLAKHRTD